MRHMARIIKSYPLYLRYRMEPRRYSNVLHFVVAAVEKKDFGGDFVGG